MWIPYHDVTYTTIRLPSDFIFQTKGVDGHWYLVRVDAQTGQWHLFYAKKGDDVGLINWSPRGDQVAIFQSDLHGTQLCVLTRTAQLISCMDNYVGQIAFYMIFGTGAGGNSYLYKVGWSKDESKIYYVTDTPNSGKVPEFIEADVTTGRTLQMLYSQSDLDPLTAVPAQNTGILLLRTAYSQNSMTTGVNLIQFQSAAQPDSKTLTSVIRKNLNVQFTPPNNYDLSAPENAQDDPHKHISDFCGFSPQGSYLTRFDSGAIYSLYDQHPYEWDILDIMGNVVYRMLPPIYSSKLIPTGCVAWAPSETVFYARQRFKSQNNNSNYLLISKYTLSGDHQIAITPFFTDAGVLDPYTGPWEISPDGNYILYEEACGQDDGCDLTTIVGPNNTVERYPGINGISAHPLWIPPLTADVLIPASPTPPSLTQTPVGTPNGGSAPGGNQING